MASIFKKFTCDCVGIPTGRPGSIPNTEQAIVIKACDTTVDDNEVGFSYRNLETGKITGAVSLSDAETDDLVKELRALLIDGYRLRDIKHALGITSLKWALEYLTADKPQPGSASPPG
jgi:hypothetical protein